MDPVDVAPALAQPFQADVKEIALGREEEDHLNNVVSGHHGDETQIEGDEEAPDPAPASQQLGRRRIVSQCT